MSVRLESRSCTYEFFRRNQGELLFLGGATTKTLVLYNFMQKKNTKNNNNNNKQTNKQTKNQNKTKQNKKQEQQQKHEFQEFYLKFRKLTMRRYNMA